ncbi:MAG: MFS transporter [Gammaproteobacteria bacterium]|nr:MAG: MFS transporter [Gammaproteobacteria bacterium]
MLQLISLLTGVHWRDQGPAFLVGFGHGGTHWIAAFFYLLLPYITRDLGLSYTDAGLLVAVFHLSSLLVNFGSGLMVDVTGRRVLFQVVSLLVGAGALFAFGVSEQFLVLALLVALIGASNNLWHPPAIAYLSEIYPDNRGYALSIHALGANLGDTLAPLAAGSLLAVLTWQGTAATGAVPVVLVALVIAVLLLRKDGRARAATGSGMGRAEYLLGLKRLVRDRLVLGLSLMAGFRSMTQNGLLMFLPLFLIDELRTGPLWMGVTMMAMQVGGLVAAPVAGICSDRIGRRPVVLSGLTVTTIVIAAITLIQNDVVLVAAVSVLGFALFAVRPVVHSWMMDLVPASLFGSATSLMFGTQALLSAAVPLIGGLIADAYGLSAVFYLLAGTMLVANFLVYLLPHQELRREE